jgi:hypothetical protein
MHVPQIIAEISAIKEGQVTMTLYLPIDSLFVAINLIASIRNQLTKTAYGCHPIEIDIIEIKTISRRFSLRI